MGDRLHLEGVSWLRADARAGHRELAKRRHPIADITPIADIAPAVGATLVVGVTLTVRLACVVDAELVLAG